MQTKNITLSASGSVGNVSVIANAGENNRTNNQGVNQGEVRFCLESTRIQPEIAHRSSENEIAPITVEKKQTKDITINISGMAGNISVVENGGSNNTQNNSAVSQSDVQFVTQQPVLRRPEQLILEQIKQLQRTS
jgi:hypothetical protein